MSNERVTPTWTQSVSNEMKGEVNCGDPAYERAVDFVKNTFQESCEMLYRQNRLCRRQTAYC